MELTIPRFGSKNGLVRPSLTRIKVLNPTRNKRNPNAERGTENAQRAKKFTVSIPIVATTAPIMMCLY